MKFSSLRSSTEESVESNRIDFPKQIRIKRKYLTSQDEVPIPCWIGAEDSVRCAEADIDIAYYVSVGFRASNGIFSADPTWNRNFIL